MAKKSGLLVTPGCELMDLFIAKGRPLFEKHY
jgi:hypothetical protein